jgi:hypothetical protein
MPAAPAVPAIPAAPPVPPLEVSDKSFLGKQAAAIRANSESAEMKRTGDMRLSDMRKAADMRP